MQTNKPSGEMTRTGRMVVRLMVATLWADMAEAVEERK